MQILFLKNNLDNLESRCPATNYMLGRAQQQARFKITASSHAASQLKVADSLKLALLRFKRIVR